MSYTVFNDKAMDMMSAVKSPFEAYCWLCCESRYDNVSHSYTFMAQAWGWHVMKVRRFLDKLVREGLLEITDTGTDTLPKSYRIVITKEIHIPHKKADTLTDTNLNKTNKNNRYCAEFERWWRLWLDKGRAVNKVKAYKEWNRVSPEARENCYNAAYRYLSGCNDPKFIMHPDRFLRDNDFTDETTELGTVFG